jgi:serine/threonine protein phosphatase 1
MSVLIVGDIHGCYVELMELVDRAGLSAGDEVLSVGDFLDRGPANGACLEFFRTQANGSAITGNHERKHLRSAAGEVTPAISQKITRLQLGSDYPACLSFLRTLPRHRELPDVTVVHGFWEPGVPLERQRDSVIIGTLSGEHHLQKHYSQPWYELYDGPKPLVVGHHDYRKDGEPLVHRDRVYALDTSCVHGGRLTGLLVPEFRFVSVPSRGDHWESQLRDFAEQAAAH